MANIDLSIVIVSYNTRLITANCINSINRSLRASKIRYEIIVADNDSNDGSHQLLSAMSENKKNHLVYFQTNQNLGFGRGNNYAVSKSKGRLILLLNSDTIILNNAIEKLYYYYTRNAKKIHFLGPKLLNFNLTPQPSAARFFTLPVVFAALLLKGDYLGLTRSSPARLQKVDWISGACLMTTRKIYDRMKGFDKKIFMYMEEVDFLYRAYKKRLYTYFYPAAQIVHLGSASSQGKTFPILQVYRGFLYFYKKHHGLIQLFGLHLILKTKAAVAYFIGKIKKDQYLVKTYEEAFWIA